MERLKKAAKQIIEDEGQEDIKVWCEQVLHNGCVSGCVMSLIDYDDTTNFFDMYEEDIRRFLQTKNQEVMGVFNIFEEHPHVIKNHIVWFVFECLVQDYFKELELD